MLAEIRIKNFALIDDLVLSFKSGLNVITGETGSGKSIIIEAINLLVGGRADATRIKQGAQDSEIEGLFIGADDSEFGLRRVLSRDGRNRAYISGRIVTTGELAELGDKLIDIHGQHEQQSLLKPKAHLDIVDRFGGSQIEEAKEAYRQTLTKYKKRVLELGEAKAVEAHRTDRLDMLAWQIKELGEADLVIGEDQELQEKVQRLKSHTRLFEAVGQAIENLSGGALDSLHLCRQELKQVGEVDAALSDVANSLDSTCESLEEISIYLRDYHESLATDAGKLDSFQTRLFFLEDLKKKYSLTLSGLIEHHESARTELDKVKSSTLLLARLNTEVDTLFRKLKKQAAVLSGARVESSRLFARLIQAQLRELDIVNCDLKVQVSSRALETDKISVDGLDMIELLFSANSGEEVRPLARIGSGGELARVMLAIRTVFGRSDGTPVLIFDEIDSGISGKTAVKVGERLSGLAGNHQIISVTHLAQIAAFADHHLAIGKTEVAGKTRVDVREVGGADRLKELSRLGGLLNESKVSVAHARQLLDQASAKKVARGS
ncbi:MAG TPA: DNA repair protein RecN [Actinobacteria bacterium]|nr:DNA repair protein RecN [Actinomycetota bacterium]